MSDSRVPSRFSMTKLKAFLIIDLIFFSAVAGTYFYLQNQGLITSGAKPAEFVLSNLTVDPAQAFPGETIQISVNITNVGGIEGNLTLDLEINNVVKDTANITLGGGASSIIEFIALEVVEGNYSVKVGELVGAFTIKPAPPETSKIIISNFISDPYEIWANENVTLTAIAVNPSNEPDKLTVKAIIDEVIVATQVISLEAGASQTIQITVNASDIAEGKHIAKLNTLKGLFEVVKTGYHTLIITRSGGGSKPLSFTLNGEEHLTVYQAILPVGEYSITVPNPVNIGTGVLEFASWSDGVRSQSRTITLDKRLLMVVSYDLVSGWASCPSLYVWNGTDYTYVAEVSNSGWLGDIDHIDENGVIIFAGGNPWDYIKLDNSLTPTADGYFDMVLTQQWDELFYFDSTYLIIVDHPVGVDAYATMSTYVNQVFNDQIYTINMSNAFSPVNATHVWGPKGTTVGEENVLSDISQIDDVFTPGNNGLYSQSWDNISLNQLTIDLGNMSGAEQIKLIINGRADWGDPEPYYPWIESFKAAAAQGLLADDTEICPAPYMEIKDTNGNWVKVPKDKQIPLPSDYVARTFVVDLTGIFPAETTNYEIRITNFWNIVWDYIGIDLTPQENITVQKITGQATLQQLWDTQSNSSGSFH